MPSNLTPADLAEGRRLLAKVCQDPTDWPPENADMIDWLWEHKDALLADREAVDVEAIKREAVRKFALEVLEIWPPVMQDESDYDKGAKGAVEVTQILVRKLAAARGANLESERGA